jgi:hypothetical protein
VSTISCAGCRYFTNRPAELESLLPGLNTLGSAFGSVRDGDGLCQLHHRYLRATSRCPEHRPLTMGAVAAAQPAAAVVATAPHRPGQRRCVA